MADMPQSLSWTHSIFRSYWDNINWDAPIVLYKDSDSRLDNCRNPVRSSVLVLFQKKLYLNFSKNPNQLISSVEQGNFDKEIDSQLTETNPEKIKKLDDFFNQIKLTQEAKLEEEKKAAEEAEKEKETAEEAPTEASKEEPEKTEPKKESKK